MFFARNRLHWRRFGWLIVLALLAGALPTRGTMALGRSLYVATNGDDANDGLSLGQAFRTIQRCATVAEAGDTCFVRGGIYRETVRPTNSGTAGAPITFTAYNHEAVTVSGLDVLTNWTQHTGNIYRAAMPWTLNNNGGDFNEINPGVNDQIFVDGAMMVEARWPNINPARQTVLSRADNARADGVSGVGSNSATYLDADLATAGDFWAGGKINFGPGFSIIYTTCPISGKSGNALAFQCVDSAWSDTMLRPSVQNNYFLWGKREALDYPGEWFREGAANAGTLSLWTPDGSNPNAHTIEAKRRVYAFDFSRRGYITLDGINIFGASVQLHDGIWLPENRSNNISIRNIEARYLWHSQHLRGFFSASGNTGIRIRGDNNEIRDSYFAASAGSMISLRGNGNLITNNVFGAMGYNGGSVGISGGMLDSAGAHNQLAQNTLFDAGRYPIQADNGLDITYNDAYNSHLQISDLGVIYGWGTDGNNAQIAYNLVHDSVGERNNDLLYYGSHGIYLDDDTYNYQVYRNVIWNTTAPGIFTFGTNGTTFLPPHNAALPSNRLIYHNTVDGEISASAKSNYHGLPQTLLGTFFRNNSSSKLALETTSGAVASSNFVGDALYLDQAARRYELRSYSPAINSGTAVGSPYADPPMQPLDAPDLGAYEFGRAPFVAGAVLRQADLPNLTTTCTADWRNSSATCSIGNLPLGRKLPADFAIRVGTGAAAACTTTMNYRTHFGVGVCQPVDTSGQTGTPPIAIRLGNGAWLATGSTVDLGPLVVLVVAPTKGSTSGVTSVTISGRKFDDSAAPFRAPITLVNATDAPLYSYQVRIQLNTAALIAAGKLAPDCADVRFSDQYGALPYWIERGCGTTSTRVWVNVAALPVGTSTMTLEYGNWTLPAGSDGAATFPFFDDFNNGVISDLWSAASSGNVVVSEIGGAMRIAGTTNAANQYDPIGFNLQTWKLALPASFALDSDWRIVAQPANQGYKASVGGASTTLGLYSASATDRKVGYWNGSQFVHVADSTLDAPTFDWQWMSTAWTPSGADQTVQHSENGTLVGSRIVPTSAAKGYFNYSPNAANVNFDVRFDNVRMRQFALPEPTASIGAESAHTVGVTFDGAACRNVVVLSGTRLVCHTPPHQAGLVDVAVTNPNAASDAAPNAYEYIELNEKVFIPHIVR